MSGHTYTGKCHLACMHADLSKCGTRKFHLGIPRRDRQPVDRTDRTGEIASAFADDMNPMPDSSGMHSSSGEPDDPPFAEPLLWPWSPSAQLEDASPLQPRSVSCILLDDGTAPMMPSSGLEVCGVCDAVPARDMAPGAPECHLAIQNIHAISIASAESLSAGYVKSCTAATAGPFHVNVPQIAHTVHIGSAISSALSMQSAAYALQQPTTALQAAALIAMQPPPLVLDQANASSQGPWPMGQPSWASPSEYWRQPQDPRTTEQVHGGVSMGQLSQVSLAAHPHLPSPAPTTCLGHAPPTRLCDFEGCKSSARAGGDHFCKRHGGGRRCQFDGCGKSGLFVQGDLTSLRALCVLHGGGRRCQQQGCSRAARSGFFQFCAAHGGGRRCEHDGCETQARPGPLHLCAKHMSNKRSKTERKVTWIHPRTGRTDLQTGLGAGQAQGHGGGHGEESDDEDGATSTTSPEASVIVGTTSPEASVLVESMHLGRSLVSSAKYAAKPTVEGVLVDQAAPAEVTATLASTSAYFVDPHPYRPLPDGGTSLSVMMSASIQTIVVVVDATRVDE